MPLPRCCRKWCMIKKVIKSMWIRSLVPCPGYKTLLEDAEAILKSDPAARSLSEVIVAYPGFYATVIYRLSHCIWTLGITICRGLFCEFAHSKTGIDIHPGAQIGKAFAIDHGTGIVIGETR
jgi:serine O-acetyltransferase